MSFLSMYRNVAFGTFLPRVTEHSFISYTLQARKPENDVTK